MYVIKVFFDAMIYTITYPFYYIKKIFKAGKK